ncbi:MAG: MarR family winged helix-turn-helix transcriptional regulator [Isosphaeraceae bacterium]|nr:MarR family winged helix-turn-helix transcriptional regulator [Isosphaeraceae bacterium]
MTDPPPEVVIADACIAVRLRLLNRAISAIYDEALRPLGLRVGQLNLLVATARMQSARAGDLCRVLRMEKSTLSRDMEILRRNGWVEWGEASGRVRPLRITPAGRELLARVLPAWRVAQDRASHVLGLEGSAAILRMARDLDLGKSSD